MPLLLGRRSLLPGKSRSETEHFSRRDGRHILDAFGLRLVRKDSVASLEQDEAQDKHGKGHGDGGGGDDDSGNGNGSSQTGGGDGSSSSSGSAGGTPSGSDGDSAAGNSDGGSSAQQSASTNGSGPSSVASPIQSSGVATVAGDGSETSLLSTQSNGAAAAAATDGDAQQTSNPAGFATSLPIASNTDSILTTLAPSVIVLETPTPTQNHQKSSSDNDQGGPNTGNDLSAKPQPMSSGAIAGIAIGTFVFLATVILVGIMLRNRRRSRRAPSAEFLTPGPSGSFQRMASVQSVQSGNVMNGSTYGSTYRY